MNLQSGTYYWPTTFPDAPSYPTLEEDLICDVLIIGGGISGAQCAYYLANTNLDIVVIDKSTIGSGSTSSTTALIQYSGDKMFTDLIYTFGTDYITRHLQLLKEAIDEMEVASKKVSIDCEFNRRDTLYYASCPEDVKKLRKEYEFLKACHMELTFLTKDEIAARYPFSKDAAIYSYNDAEMNPFKFTHALLDYATKRRVRVYENTEMNGHHYDKAPNKWLVSTKNGYSIQTQYVIFAVGYEGLEIKKEKKASLVSTFTIITNPVKDLSEWHNRSLIWETARPYLYMRTTKDNRILIGGLDDNTNSSEERDSRLFFKKKQLLKELKNLFPAIDAKIDFFLSSFFGGIVDGIPIIGKYEQFPNCYFLFAFGDNGTVYSQLLSRLIVDEIVKGESPDLALYLQDRPLVN